jgi:hypothetical protein
MKKIHIALLLMVAAGIASLSFFLKDLTTYSSFTTAKKEHLNKFVHIVAKLDKTKPIDWAPATNPNYLGFHATDSLGGSTKVVFNNNMPADFEKSDRLVLKGYMRNSYFECKDIQLKCPSKYKDEEAAGAKHPDQIQRNAAPINAQTK